MSHICLTVQELEDGRCACMVRRTATFFLYNEDDKQAAYCDVCKRQIIPSERETIYNSHGMHHEGWGFVVVNHQPSMRSAYANLNEDGTISVHGIQSLAKPQST